MGIFSILERALLRFVVTRHKLGFSQFGEEKLVGKLLGKMGVKDIYYLDIGTNDPVYNNNTYLFYCRGHKGVCVEANPDLARKTQKLRPRDICLNVGACGDDTEAEKTFFLLSSNVLSSFSAEFMPSENDSVREISIKMTSVDKIITEACEKEPNFISIDVEGMEEEIIRSFDFSKHSPEVFCIETLELNGKKRTDIIDFMATKNYLAIADTYVNTIFVNKERWENRTR